MLPDVLSKGAMNEQVMYVLRGIPTENTNPWSMPTFPEEDLPGEKFVVNSQPKK
jgi:hypothetical protein